MNPDKALVPIDKLTIEKAQVAAEDLHDRAAEEMVVGYAISSPYMLEGDWMSQVKSSCFHDTDTRLAWNAVRQVYNEDGIVLAVRVSDVLQSGGAEDAPTGVDLLAWSDVNGLGPEAEHYAKKLVTLAEHRRIQWTAGQTIRMLHDPQAPHLEPGQATLAIQGQIANLPVRVKDTDEYTADALARVDDSGDLYLVDGVVQDAGLNIIMGEGGIGKSMLALDLSMKVLTGGSALGGQVNRQGGVLYLGADVDTRTMKRRVGRMRIASGVAADGELDGFLYIRAPLDFADPADFQLIQHKAAKMEAALIVVDALTSYMFHLDENSQRDMSLVINQLRLLAERTRSCVLVLHHVNKNAFAEGSNKARGSTVLPNGVDCVLHVSRRGTSLLMGQTKNRNAELMTPLQYQVLDMDDGGLAVVYDQARPQDVGAVMEGIALDAMVGVLKGVPGEALSKQHLYLAVEASGHFSRATLQRAWDALKRVPGVTLGTMGRQATVLYQEPNQPLTT